MAQTFERFVNDNNFYEESFINHFGVTDPHWPQSSWQERERFLRHHKVCFLLCNLELAKRKATDDPDEPSTSKRYHMDDYFEFEFDDDEQMEDAEEEPEEEVSTKYRFICLEGKSSTQVSLLQSQYARKWGINIPGKKWDIIDTVGETFCEIKIAIREDEYVLEWENNSVGLEGHTNLTILHPNQLSIKQWGKITSFRGEEKAIDFLTRRYMYLQSNHVFEGETNEIEDPTKHIFCDPITNAEVTTWANHIWSKSKQPLSIPSIMQITTPQSVDAHELLKHLKDPRTINGNTVQYKGKILPSFLCDSEETSDTKDIEMVKRFVKDLPSVDLFDEIKQALIEGNNFCMIDKKNIAKFPVLKQWLGIGRKPGIRDDSDKNTKQEEYTPKTPEKYHSWVHSMIEDLAQHCEYSAYSQLTRMENKPESPMAKITSEVVSKIYENIATSQSAVYMSKLTNFYSRLGGSYLSDEKQMSNHGNISILPLYATVQKNNETFRLLDGVCIRGPHHAKNPTDKVNLIIIEKLSKNPKATRYFSHIKKSSFVCNGDTWYSVRQNAILRHDPTYLTFAANCTFTPINMIGEIAEAKMLRDNLNPRLYSQTCMQLVQENNSWFMKRISESLMMATLGGSNEEGTLAFVRKYFMLMLAWSRGEEALCLDIESFCVKTNECTQNGAMAQYYIVSIIDALSKYSREGRGFYW